METNTLTASTLLTAARLNGREVYCPGTDLYVLMLSYRPDMSIVRCPLRGITGMPTADLDLNQWNY